MKITTIPNNVIQTINQNKTRSALIVAAVAVIIASGVLLALYHPSSASLFSSIQGKIAIGGAGVIALGASAWLIKSSYSTNRPSPSEKNVSNQIDNLEIGPDQITEGQGEYLVFHQLPNGEKRAISREIFEKVYQVLLRYSPISMANRDEDLLSRYDLLRAKINEIDPSLEAVFVPRTLYELVFIRKCIKEDLRQNNICSYLSKSSQRIINGTDDYNLSNEERDRTLKSIAKNRAKRKCWHLGYFLDSGDNEHAGVKEVVYRLNKAMIKALNPSKEGFTNQELAVFADKEIEFLKTHHQKVDPITNCSHPGPTTNFGSESFRGDIKPMGIRDDKDAQIIRNAVALECSKIAGHSLFVYRGANFKKDAVTAWKNPNIPYSISYGASLFAGSLFDGGATAFHYMRKSENAYAIPIPVDQVKDSPFYVPSTHPVAQLFGDGEIFHARTKVWKGHDINNIGGMNIGGNGHIRDHLKSDLSRDEFIKRFGKLKKQAIQLK